MNNLELVKLIATLINPLLVILFGVILTKKVEKIRIQSMIQKEWHIKWAERFFMTFSEINSLIERIILNFHKLSYLDLDGKINSKAANEAKKELNEAIPELSRKEFSLRTQIGFAPKSSSNLKNSIQCLFNLLRNLIEKNEGNVDDIQDALIHLNREAMLAHSEMLGIHTK